MQTNDQWNWNDNVSEKFGNRKLLCNIQSLAFVNDVLAHNQQEYHQPNKDYKTEDIVNF